MMLYKNYTIIILLTTTNLFGQFSLDYVDVSQITLQGEKYSFVKMTRKDNHVKAKYFAAKDHNGLSVYDRYNSWSIGKNIILYSSGTYLDNCDAKFAQPQGICIDDGNIVNRALSTKFDALVIFYATGGIVVSDIKNDNLTISGNGVSKKVDIKNSLHRMEFFNWATAEKATVFQSHLFYYKDSLTIATNSDKKVAPRRFLCVGRHEGDVMHYIVYLSTDNTLYDATLKISNFLKNYESLDELIFIVNLDTGCQNVFQLRKNDGSIDNRTEFKGDVPITNAANLIVYYYE